MLTIPVRELVKQNFHKLKYFLERLFHEDALDDAFYILFFLGLTYFFLHLPLGSASRIFCQLSPHAVGRFGKVGKAKVNLEPTFLHGVAPRSGA
jgi:hypothetical protein